MDQRYGNLQLSRPVRWLLGICLGQLAICFLFRAFIWASWVPAPGDPYGVADVVEVALFIGLLLASCAAFSTGIACALVERWRDFRAINALCIIGIASPGTYIALHSFVPTFRLW